MRNKKIYRILLALAIIGFYLFEKYYDADTGQSQPNTNNKDMVSEEEEVSTNLSLARYLPRSTTGVIVNHEYYTLSYNEMHEQAEWVAYELKKEHLTYDDRKRPYFNQDPKVETGSADWRNYKNSGYDRGHLCPAGDRRFSVAAYNQTFLTSNVSPQEHHFNSGLWNRLEQQARYWAKKHNGIFIITGGVLNGKLVTIGEEKVSVPDYFYKIIIDERDGDIRTAAFLVPHKESKASLETFRVSIDSIEAVTGVDFLYKLNDQLELETEKDVSLGYWF
ncbi:DNA/RNA non-specific endonuclease [Zhouia spongiae]|uniref:Endonuclease n=1 Tax=Zhouia spongiae TaxID=2202721 RepID=A0ABY3YQS8_9FLAO|nr:DNA/RNA non-specific endonuclease [Zhouia spongiae]UNZ00172.1 DNA/RNA non-specific endonuclease [Zhouia spongiae]